ncbi:MAG: hypothetical protein PHR06_10445 [Candidatus Cloacimonetes bacterium]|nr:hypothetical protein [Candidatus Cloacimonadota bacterium]
MGNRRWSKLQKEINLIISPDIKFQIHCMAYRMRSQHGTTDLPRYWITLDKEVIFDYPKDFLDMSMLPNSQNVWQCDDFTVKERYPYVTEISDISDVLRIYIDTPIGELFDRTFEGDRWGLCDILKSADKRIGKRRLSELSERSKSEAVRKVIEKRLVTTN